MFEALLFAVGIVALMIVGGIVLGFIMSAVADKLTEYIGFNWSHFLLMGILVLLLIGVLWREAYNQGISFEEKEKIEKVEKGKISESFLYARYWSRKWKGIGLPPPGGQSYENQPKKGQTCRFYLARNAYDGWSRKGNKDGGYNVVYVNGIQPINK